MTIYCRPPPPHTHTWVVEDEVVLASSYLPGDALQPTSGCDSLHIEWVLQPTGRLEATATSSTPALLQKCHGKANEPGQGHPPSPTPLRVVSKCKCTCLALVFVLMGCNVVSAPLVLMGVWRHGLTGSTKKGFHSSQWNSPNKFPFPP